MMAVCVCVCVCTRSICLSEICLCVGISGDLITNCTAHFPQKSKINVGLEPNNEQNANIINCLFGFFLCRSLSGFKCIRKKTYTTKSPATNAKFYAMNDNVRCELSFANKMMNISNETNTTSRKHAHCDLPVCVTNIEEDYAHSVCYTFSRSFPPLSSR